MNDSDYGSNTGCDDYKAGKSAVKPYLRIYGFPLDYTGARRNLHVL